ncbi:MAG: CvpA family protein [Oscillospiraceae bacterium]|nr:CvpA family protein [Oscillospiraceae bacterium]
MEQLTPALIVDIVIGLLLLLGLVIGIWQGLLRLLHGVISVLVALLAGRFVAMKLAPILATHVAPRIEAPIAQRLGEVLLEKSTDGGLGALALIPGIDELIEQAAQSAADLMAASVAQVIAEIVLGILLVLLTVLAVRLLCRVLLWLFERIDELQGIHLLNHVAGAAIGVLAAVAAVEIAAFLLLFFGVLPPELAEASWFLGALL